MGMRELWQRLTGHPALAAAPIASTTPVPAAMARFELQRELGRGAMAVVHLALDRETGQVVALKRMALQREFAPEDLADVHQRFLREARAAQQLQHPDILRVLQAGEVGADAWIAMEVVQGQDLSQFTQLGHLLPVDVVLAITVRLARALHYAHSQGVVHRDIKPANVMWDRETGVLKIMDFGIARIADGSRTRTGLVLGTPSFMAPEQLTGQRVDGRCDLYALGVLCYQMLTAQLPHQSDSLAELMRSIATLAPPDVRQHRPGLPETLAQVLDLAMQKRPELRYANGEALAQDMEAVRVLLGSADLAPPSDSAGVNAAFAHTQRLHVAEAGQNEG